MGNVYSITLCDRDLHHVPDDIYRHHKHVAKLLLRRNNIQEIPPEIKVLTNLVELSLRDNLLTSVPVEITSLKLLQKLSLANNRLQEPPEPIATFSQLTWLSLASNTLTSLPDSFGNLHKLTSLDLQRNRFSTIPDCIFQMRSLQILLMQKNRIAVISPKISQCTALVSVNLSYNRIQYLPLEMRECRKLQHLLLSVNNIQVLPAVLCEAWSNLLNLDLHTNDLRRLPDQLGCLTSLRRLNLAINKIVEIPNSIGQLRLLEWLNLNDNKLVNLPESMDQMQMLIKMGIVQNKLQTLPAALARLNVLYKLDCRRNEIEYLPSAFKEMQGIHSLLLEENPLSMRYGITNYSRQPPSLLELASRAVLERYCPQQSGSLNGAGSKGSRDASTLDSSGGEIAHLLPIMADLGLSNASKLPSPSVPTTPHTITPQKSRYSFFSRACSTVHPHVPSKPTRTSTLTSTCSTDSSSSSPSSSSSASSSSSSYSPSSSTSPSSTSISSAFNSRNSNSYLSPAYAMGENSTVKGKRHRISPRNLRTPALFRRSSKSNSGKPLQLNQAITPSSPTATHQQLVNPRRTSMSPCFMHDDAPVSVTRDQSDLSRKSRHQTKVDSLLDPETSLLPITLINHLSMPLTTCDYCSRRMCTSGWVDFLEPAIVGGSARMIVPIRHRMCSLQCVRRQHQDSFGGELTEYFEHTDFHIGPNGEMIGSRPIAPGELDEYMIEAVQEAANAAGISIVHLLEQHQQQQFQEQDQHMDQQHEIHATVPQDIMSEVLHSGSIPITASHHVNQFENLAVRQIGGSLSSSSSSSSGPASVIRQTTARLRRSLSRPVMPIEIQVDGQGQLRRIVYRQNIRNQSFGGSNISHRRRFLDTVRSFGSQVAGNGQGSNGVSLGLGGGNGVGGGIGGLGVLTTAGLAYHPHANGHGGGGILDTGAAGRGAMANVTMLRAAGEVMNVTTFAVELERY
ncbi:hypothetical protein EDD11_000174 [Mortierella claussenii]|nr:hypothetical protein EDD11_000174 [Mortierella claussenii]